MTQRAGPDEFYVGYFDRMPPGLGNRMRTLVGVLITGAAILAAVLAVFQRPLEPAFFEFGVTRSFEGVAVADPYPNLRVPRPGQVGDLPGFSRFLVANFGKLGAQKDLRIWTGRRVELSGSLIYRDEQSMIELQAGSIREARTAGGSEPSEGEAAEVLSGEPVTLRGEIVDSKCFLGVMNPGNLKAHRSCATLCIRGGIPPVLVVRDSLGAAVYFLLVSSTGAAVNREVLPFVAEPIEVTGTVTRMDDLLILEANPETYRRLLQ